MCGSLAEAEEGKDEHDHDDQADDIDDSIHGVPPQQDGGRYKQGTEAEVIGSLAPRLDLPFARGSVSHAGLARSQTRTF
jgi:hypothetical protein